MSSLEEARSFGVWDGHGETKYQQFVKSEGNLFRKQPMTQIGTSFGVRTFATAVGTYASPHQLEYSLRLIMTADAKEAAFQRDIIAQMLAGGWVLREPANPEDCAGIPRPMHNTEVTACD